MTASGQEPEKREGRPLSQAGVELVREKVGQMPEGPERALFSVLLATIDALSAEMEANKEALKKMPIARALYASKGRGRRSARRRGGRWRRSPWPSSHRRSSWPR